MTVFSARAHAATAVIALGVAFLAAGCGNPSWTTYEETSEMTAPPVSSAAERAGTSPSPAQASSWAWTTPDGWSEAPGSGMRLATLTVPRDGGPATCTIVALSATAGDETANIRRWIGQLGLAEPSNEDLTAFVAQQERFRSEGGFDGLLVDLTTMGPPAPDAESMLAAIIATGRATLFVKLTGPAGFLQEQRAAFAALCRSLRPKP